MHKKVLPDSNYLNYLDEQTRIYEVVKMWCDGMTDSDISENTGLSKHTIRSMKSKAKAKAARHGYAPENDMFKDTPQGFHVKGVSTLYDADGQVKVQWVKTSSEADDLLEKMKDDFAEWLSSVPIMPKIKKPKNKDKDKDLIPWFNIGDGHLGMLAMDSEVGHNFDLDIAKNELIEAMSLLIDRAPSCERCVIQDMGDMTHYQDFMGQTESGHILDFDKRYPKMIETYHAVMRYMVNYALSKFDYVDVIINQGNHSRSNDIHMVQTLRWVYQDNPRLKVLDNSSVFIPYRMGNTFVMCHHSDKCKPNRLVDVMATDFAKDWGEAFYRYIDIGHIHHRMSAKEMSGVIVESWNQLAPSDKYAHDGGWRSRSFLTCVLRSKTYGETGRITLTAEEVKDRLMNLEAGTTVNARRNVYSV